MLIQNQEQFNASQNFFFLHGSPSTSLQKLNRKEEYRNENQQIE
ncbi:hypothetical protein [Marinifilum sp.]